MSSLLPPWIPNSPTRYIQGTASSRAQNQERSNATAASRRAARPCLAIRRMFTRTQRFHRQPFAAGRSLTASEISAWAHRLRDDWNVKDVQELLLARPGADLDLQSFLFHLDRTDVSRTLLECTRIHLALKEIVTEENGWNERIKSQACATLSGWEALFGDIDEILPDPWARGNPMEGIFRLKPSSTRSMTSTGTLKETWIVRGAPDSDTALTWGHNGFHVGQ